MPPRRPSDKGTAWLAASGNWLPDRLVQRSFGDHEQRDKCPLRVKSRKALRGQMFSVLPLKADPSARSECPVEAIKPDTEAGAEKWLTLNAEYAKIWPNITKKRVPPADSKEWEGKPDKLRYFSPNPGEGD